MDKEKVISKLEKEVQRTYSTKTIVFQNGEKVSEEINTHREPNVRISIEMLDKILALLKENEVVVRCKDCKYANHDTKYLIDENLYDCVWHEENHSPNYYCASGERKDGYSDDKVR